MLKFVIIKIFARIPSISIGTPIETFSSCQAPIVVWIVLILINVTSLVNKQRLQTNLSCGAITTARRKVISIA